MVYFPEYSCKQKGWAMTPFHGRHGWGIYYTKNEWSVKHAQGRSDWESLEFVAAICKISSEDVVMLKLTYGN